MVRHITHPIPHFLRKEELVLKMQVIRNMNFLNKQWHVTTYVLWDDENFIIAFRGTQPKEMKDVFNDMKFWKRPAWEGGKVHTGFPKLC